MSLNVAEARQMLEASRKHPNLVAQIVPSPFGLKGDAVIRELIDSDFLGTLREVQVSWLNPALADAAAPLSWRQDAGLSGYNTLALGIVHETALRWMPPPVRVLAQAHAFIPSRIDPESGVRRAVGTPDHVQVLAILKRAPAPPISAAASLRSDRSGEIWLSAVRRYRLRPADRSDLWRSRRSGRQAHGSRARQDPHPCRQEGGWSRKSSVHAIRTGSPVRFTDFATGFYMEFN